MDKYAGKPSKLSLINLNIEFRKSKTTIAYIELDSKMREVASFMNFHHRIRILFWPSSNREKNISVISNNTVIVNID